MYRFLMVVLAIAVASCASSRQSDRPAGPDGDATKGDAVMAQYDARDDTIEVVGERRAAQPELENRILALVNRERESAGVKPLFFSPELAKAARQHSFAMAQAGFFEHRGVGEPELFERVNASGIEADRVGENIFQTSEMASSGLADECVRMWMQSDGHRLNMLSPEFDKTGIAVGVSHSGENYITEDFAH